MLKEFVEYIRGLKGFETVQVGAKTYSDKQLAVVEPPVYHTEEKKLSSLDALVQLVANEAANYDNVYIHVIDPLHVEAFTDTDDHKERDALCRVEYGGPTFTELPLEIPAALLQLQGLCEPGEDRDYLLAALKDITMMREEDYSRSGKMVATSALTTGGAFKEQVNLKPTRTFLEVEQPESLFYLNVAEQEWTDFAPVFQNLFSTQQKPPETKRGVRVTLVCADGGRWKRTAMDSIRTYLRKKTDECEVDNVLVI